MKVYYYNDVLTDEERKADAERFAQNQKKQEEEKTQRRATEAEYRKKARRKRLQDLIRKSWGYLTLEFVQIRQGPTPRKEYKRRVELCMACPGRTEEMDGKRDEGGIGFCTKCGCPASQRSQLSVKLTISSLACPLNKFGPVQGSGATWRNAARSLLGVLQTLRAVVTRRK